MKKKIFMIITVLMLCLLAGGCSVEVQNDPNTQSVYYLYDISADETQLEKVDYNPEETTADWQKSNRFMRNSRNCLRLQAPSMKQKLVS